MIPESPSQSTQEREITALFLGCQVDPELWVPVKKMIWSQSGYRTGYVAGVKQAIDSSRLWHHFFGLSPLDRVDLTRDIHPNYACRMPLARPHEMAFDAPYLGLPADSIDPIAYVARSGGYRQTDSLDVFPEVKPDRDGCYRFFFGLGNFNLQVDSRLLADIMRSPDRLAARGHVAIDRQTGIAIGSLPGYITAIVAQYPNNVRLQIDRANDAFFTRHKLLCSATCLGFRPFSTESYLPIGNLDASS